MVDPTDPKWLAVLATSQLLWAVLHVAVASLFRNQLIVWLGKQRYITAFAATSLGWFGANTLLLSWVTPGVPLFAMPVALDTVGTVIRLVAYLLLLTLLWAQPSPMDIAAQRVRRLAQRNESTRLANADFYPSDVAPEQSDGLTKIVRHPQFFGFALLLVSLLLSDGVTAAEVAYAAPALALVVLGIGFQERRMLSDATVRDFLQQTSNIPGWAVITGRTTLSWRELGQLGHHAAIPAMLVGGLVMLGLLGGESARQALTPNYPQAAWFIFAYIILLALREITATLTSRHLRAT